MVTRSIYKNFFKLSKQMKSQDQLHFLIYSLY